jgi:cytochrome c553
MSTFKRAALAAAALACHSLLLSSVASAGPAVTSERGRQLARQCAACHGIDGNSPLPKAYPNLAAQAPAYLELQLNNFASGERPSAVMKAIATGLSAGDRRELGRYFGAQAAKAQPSSDRKLELQGKAVFTHGGSGGAPACASCHGAMGHGQANFPRIASQPAQYLLEQLHVYHDVPHFNNPLAMTMKEVALKLSTGEMEAVSAYIATLP